MNCLGILINSSASKLSLGVTISLYKSRVWILLTETTSVQFSSVQLLSHVRLFVTPWTAARQASLSITNSRSPPKPMSLSCPLSWWCHPTISSSLIPLYYCPQSFPASESFPRSELFAWGGQSTGVSALASFLPKTSQGWSIHFYAYFDFFCDLLVIQKCVV